jgi:hypothetical protein
MLITPKRTPQMNYRLGRAVKSIAVAMLMLSAVAGPPAAHAQGVASTTAVAPASSRRRPTLAR